MTTEQERKKRGIFLILGIAALFLLAAFAANSGIPWLEAWFDGGGSAVASAGSNRLGGNVADGSDGSADGSESGNGCFLGLICLYANAGADSADVNASADDEGVNANASN
jgi:hypothetical protein